MPVPVPPIPVTRPVRPVRVFSVNPVHGGNHRYTLKDLENVVRNFNAFQAQRDPRFPVPRAVNLPVADVGIGHEADELVRRILQRSDLPSCGYPSRLWLQGPDLYAELDGVPLEIAQLCDAEFFSDVSAEIYPNYVGPDRKAYGPTLRRISLVGGNPARLRGLQPGGRLPRFVMSEPARGSRPEQQYVAVFSEFHVMSEEEARALISKVFPDANLEGIPPAFIIMVAAKLGELIPPETPVTPAETPPAGGDATGVIQPDTFAERVLTTLAPRLRQMIQAENQPLVRTLAGLQSSFGTIAQTADRQALETFAEANKGKLFPFERDPANPKYVVNRLLKLPVAERRAEQEAIEARPVVDRFSELMPEPTGPAGGRMSEDRRAELLGHSPHGRAVLRREQVAARTHAAAGRAAGGITRG